MGQAVPESDLPGSEVPMADMPDAVDKKKYGNAPASTFAANAVNALTFGLPEYLNKTFTPENYAELQQYQMANPMAANMGTATGEVAGFAVPAGYGAVKGAQLGLRGAEALLAKYGPNLGELARLYGKSQAGLTGGAMGAQAGSAVPGIVSGDPGSAVAGPELINQYASKIPMINHLGALTGNIVPAVAGVAATGTQALKNQLMTPPTANMEYNPYAQVQRGEYTTPGAAGAANQRMAVANQRYGGLTPQEQAILDKDRLNMAVRMQAARRILGQ
jgi:hypothetical protein